MNLDIQNVVGNDQIHILDALNASILKLKVNKENYTLPTGTSNVIIYIDKQDKTNPSSERRTYEFDLSDQLLFLAQSPVSEYSDEFHINFEVIENKLTMKTYVVRYIGIDPVTSEKYVLQNPVIEEVDSIPIILFEGENYIYTNYQYMNIEFSYLKNVEANKIIISSAIFAEHEMDNNGEFSLDDIYFKDAFTIENDELNLEVDNATIKCLSSKNNAFSLDAQGNLVVNSITSNINNGLTALDVYPIGSIYLSVSGTNPNSYFGGTWELFGKGRTLVCVDTSQTEFNTSQKTGGEKTHTLSVNEMPSHTHVQNSHRHQTYNTWGLNSGNNGLNYVSGMSDDGYNGSNNYTNYATATNQNTGGSQAHNNLQPYITCYMWKRTA